MRPVSGLVFTAVLACFSAYGMGAAEARGGGHGGAGRASVRLALPRGVAFQRSKGFGSGGFVRGPGFGPGYGDRFSFGRGFGGRGYGQAGGRGTDGYGAFGYGAGPYGGYVGNVPSYRSGYGAPVAVGMRAPPVTSPAIYVVGAGRVRSAGHGPSGRGPVESRPADALGESGVVGTGPRVIQVR